MNKYISISISINRYIGIFIYLYLSIYPSIYLFIYLAAYRACNDLEPGTGHVLRANNNGNEKDVVYTYTHIFIQEGL